MSAQTETERQAREQAWIKLVLASRDPNDQPYSTTLTDQEQQWFQLCKGRSGQVRGSLPVRLQDVDQVQALLRAKVDINKEHWVRPARLYDEHPRW